MLSGSKSITDQDITLSVDWTGTNNKDNNTSSITAVVSLTSKVAIATEDTSYNITVIINDGSPNTSSYNLDLKANTKTSMKTTTSTLSHDIKGLLTLVIDAKIDINDTINDKTYKTIEVTSTDEVDTIDRRSTLAVPAEIDISNSTNIPAKLYDDSFITKVSIVDSKGTSWYSSDKLLDDINLTYTTAQQIVIMKALGGYFDNEELTITIGTYYQDELLGDEITYNSKGTSVKYSTITGKDITVLDTVPYEVTSADEVTNNVTMKAADGTTITTFKLATLKGNITLAKNEIDTLLTYLVGKAEGTYTLSIDSLLNDYNFYTSVSTAYKVTSLPNATAEDKEFEGGTIPSVSFNDTDSRSGFSYDIVFKIGTFTKSYLDKQVGSEYALDFTNDDIDKIYQNTANSITTTGSLTITTYYDRVQIQVPTSAVMKVDIHNADPILLNTFYWQDTNQKIVGVTNDSKQLVKGQSTAQVVLPSGFSSGTKHATIKKVNIKYNSKSTDYDFKDSITESEGLVDYDDISLVITVTDSRGYTATKSKTGVTNKYSEPTISSSDVTRSDNFDKNVNISIQGQFDLLPINNVNKNSIISIKYRSKSSTSDWTSYYPLEFSNVTNLFLVSTQVSLDNTIDWTIEVVISDKITDKTLSFTIGTPTPTFFIDVKKHSLGVNCYPINDNSLEINGDIIANNKSIVNSSIKIDMVKGSSSNWTAPYPDGTTSSDVYITAIFMKQGTTTKQILNASVTYDDDGFLLTQANADSIQLIVEKL